MSAETLPFQAEVSRLLDIVAHALYSDREVFLRELISNASDAADRRRYLALTDASVPAASEAYRIVITPDKKAGKLTISDNGVGMSREDLVTHLGTIAHSGTGKFAAALASDSKANDAKSDLSLIGQFGVGFYAAFMVASEVTVVSRKAGEDVAHQWRSDGKGGFTIEPATRTEPGTDIVLTLRDDAKDFLDPDTLRRIVRTYSDHIAIPIVLLENGKEETVNSSAALWCRAKSEITPEQATNFYQSLSHGKAKPWATIHIRAEGTLEFSAMLFIPESPPFALFDAERRHNVKLYVRRVFITDEAKDLVPGYLRFLVGVVDSADLPLNVSRELLQNNPLIAKIRQNLTKRVLAELEKHGHDADYAEFWTNFGAVLKEGLYEDFENRDALLKLARFHSTTQPAEWLSLDAYVDRMKDGQDAIYTISGDTVEAMLASPQLEGFKARGIEVLLLPDPVDEFWVPAISAYRGKNFVSVTRAGADLSKVKLADSAEKPATEAPAAGEIAKLIALLKLTLGDAVKDVRESQRLTTSAVCLTSDVSDVDIHLEKLLREHRQLDKIAKRILEINPNHSLIRALIIAVGQKGASSRLADAAYLLLDQARILQGETISDPAGFARRLNEVLGAALGAAETKAAA